MNAKWILAIIAGVFLVLAITQMRGRAGPLSIAGRTWLLVALIFSGVSGYLFLTA